MLINLPEKDNKLTLSDTALPLAAAHAPALVELQVQLDEFNRSAITYSRAICLHQLFEQQVARTPNAISLVFGDISLTYAEMNARANQVAHRLQKLGAKPETMVGICMERSLEMVIAMYGILKAGGAYVPLDPSYPAERLAFMMEDADVPILLTQKHLRENLPPHNAQVICLDTEGESIAQESTENVTSDVTEEHLAYVIFTSGSTGKPKGVMIEHRGICNQLQWMQDRYPMSVADAVLLKTPFSFDLSLYEFFSPLIAGARLVIAQPDGQKDTDYLIELMQRERVTHLYMVPSHLQMLLENPTFAQCAALKHVLCSGEALPLAVQQRFFAQFPAPTALTNLYGPTEASVECTFWDCERDTKRNIVPVGRPIANYKIHILDEALQPVPVGTAGELFIEGIGLARGYLKRPELTQEKFLTIADCGSQITDYTNQNPQPTTHNQKLYRTGDLARWLPEGIVECLGRIDFQVKIRGHRIELGEIETDLAAHPDIREAVVIAREDNPGDKRLVAYFVAASEARPTNQELRNFLQQKLPDYMIPALFLRLAAMPLSPNSKIDRKQLPAPYEIPREMEADFIAPENEIELKLQAIWETVFALRPISVTDNFFDLGGHSLLAIRIFWALEKEFKQRLPLAAIFQCPTIRQLAELLQTWLTEEASAESLTITASLHQSVGGDDEMRPLSQRIENLSPAKRALLEMQLREKMRRSENEIRPRPHQSNAPLTFNQESLWFLEQLNPHSATYNVYDALRLRGALDEKFLQRSLEMIVARHEALRTSIQIVNGEPQQIIHATQPVQIKSIDVSSTHADKREQAAMQALALAAEQPFDLAQSPLVRFALVKLQSDEFIFFVSMHHILSDGWSMGIFWQEFTQIYDSLAQGMPPMLAPLPIQFGDFAAWQQEQKAAAITQQLSYWRQQLAGAPALLQFPTDAPRPAVQSFRGAQASTVFSKTLHHDLRDFSRRENVTLFMTLLTAFKTLLVRYTEQEDIVLGAPLAGRAQSQTENLIGFFANVLVLRTDLSGDLDFRTALRQCRETVLGAFSHQDVPFEKLVEELRPERSLSHNPIFQIAFALQPENSADLQITNFELTPVKISVVNSKFDMFFSLAETPAGLRATVEYNTDLFTSATIEKLLERYQNFLAAIVANPTTRISALPMLSAQEEILLREWNNTTTEYPREDCLHTLFEQQVERTPDAVAVVAGEVNLTYRELNRRANQLAHYLREQDVQPDTLVGLYTDRSLLMVIGVLGILKAGGAYLPLDPNFPKSRLAFMLEDAQTPVILTQQKLRASVPTTTAQIVCLDMDWATIGVQSEANPANITHAKNLAYAIYTSGSTGQPKGTLIEHRAVNRLVHNTNYIQIDASDCIAQISNIAFDAATFELWGALLHGARLVLINKEIALSPQEFVTQLRTENITAMFMTTSLFNLLSREVPTAFKPLKTLMVGGEALDPDCIRAVLKNGAPARLLNAYGPTESTTFATWHLITDVPEKATSIPIGRPISNTTIHILDRNFQPAPIGVPGEVFIGGDGLARGYLNRPELTEEKFRILSFEFRAQELQARNTKHETRVYATGDIARFLPDGSIDFIGRKDDQIKLRGFRIELGEIEGAMLAHPAIQDCVVIAATSATTADKRLLAYFVASQNPAPTPQELRTFLQTQLPDFMLPAQFVVLPEMPLNQNGKVDRKKLPQPENVAVDHATEFAPPTNELETQLVKIWSEKLGVQRISINDNFFALGGHSLIAVRVFSALEKTLGIRLPLATLFKAPTIKQLAAAIRELGWESSWQAIVPLHVQGSRPPFFCVHAVGGNVLEYQDLARYFHPDQPFYALQSLGLDGKRKPLTTIPEMAAHYIQEIRELQPTGPYYLGGRSFGGAVAFEMAQQLQAQGESVALLAMLDTYPLGWKDLIAPNEAKRLQKEFMRLRINRHLANLRQLSLREKISYILIKADYKKRKYKNWAWRAQQKFAGAEAASLQRALRNIEELNFIAAKKYAPQRYSGHVTFFCADAEISVDESLTGWRILADDVEVVTVPGDHQTMIKEPHVQQLAAQLDECLQRAQRQ